MARGVLVGLAMSCLLLGAACGEIPEPEAFTVAPPTTSSTPARPSGDELSADRQNPGTGAGPTTTAADFVPRAPDDYVAEVLVAAAGALFANGEQQPDGTLPLFPLSSTLASPGATRAVDDLLGGLVVQQSPAPPAELGEVLWLRAEGAEPVAVDPEGGALLLDVGYSGGSPVAVVQRPAGQVDQIRLVDGENTSLLQPGPDETLLDLSASGGLHAAAFSNNQCGDLRFYAADGTEVELPGPGEPDCIVPRRPAYGTVALNPDGDALAYTIVTYRDDGIEVATELVVRDLNSGIDYFRRKIGEDGDQVGALGFDGTRVVYLRASPSATAVTILELDGDKREIPLALPPGTTPLSVTFTRSALAGR